MVLKHVLSGVLFGKKVYGDGQSIDVVFCALMHRPHRYLASNAGPLPLAVCYLELCRAARVNWLATPDSQIRK